MLAPDAIVSRIATKLTGNPEGLGGDAVALSCMVEVQNTALIKASNRLNGAHIYLTEGYDVLIVCSSGSE